MNKLRLIRIFELRGKIHPIEAFMIELLDGIEEVPHQNKIYYKKGGELYFTYYSNINYLWISSIWFPFSSKYGCSYDDIIEINKYLLEKHLNITINNVLYYE